MRRILIRISLIMLISVLVVGFTTANNQKKVVQKKSESYFIITKIIDHGFRLLDEKQDSLLNFSQDTLHPCFIFEFEVLNNSNLTITKTNFAGHIFLPNIDYAVYKGSDTTYESEYLKDNWKPKTKRTIKIFMHTYVYVDNQVCIAQFDHTPEVAT
jgi:hypothetical protein